ncbi:MAG: SUF system NifU family Fe-S cluster assembly protein [Parcubacteria group bacterium]|nr:SUF system NifU family Fe-S cluster assembly protein [Parcubacteria group bacterium]
MEDTLYRDTLLDHYHNPRNYGLRDSFDMEAKGTNPLCGDSLTLRLKLDGGKIFDVCFESEGCVISRASASLLLEHIKGKAVAEAKAVTPEIVFSLLGVAIMPARLKCALLPLETVQSLL